ncbi:MAG: energy-coupled thiamine transporter ThiT [Clostridia bacterium]|nr:energy-coupled thiamine transporter ThiT [Clostridia bacterium]
MKMTVRLTESAVMLALATVLSLIPLAELPYGGSITACSMLPLVVIAYRHGTKWGLFSGLVHGLLQMFLGMKNVMYFTTPLSIAAVIVLDYLLAFAVIGLAGVFRRVGKGQTGAMVLGALVGSTLRYLLHVLAGATVWAGLSIPTEAALTYSFVYNLTYMLPETLVLLLGVGFVSRVIDFRTPMLSRVSQADGKIDGFAIGAALGAAVTLIADVVLVFSRLQNADTGEFAIEGLASADWVTVGIVTVVGAVAVGALLIVRFVRRKHAR